LFTQSQRGGLNTSIANTSSCASARWRHVRRDLQHLAGLDVDHLLLVADPEPQRALHHVAELLVLVVVLGRTAARRQEHLRQRDLVAAHELAAEGGFTSSRGRSSHRVCVTALSVSIASSS
jgi:hypothetical protein